MKRLLQFSLLITSIIAIIISCAKEEPEVKKFNLTVSASEGGSVSTQGGVYVEGEIARVTATPSDGYVFSGWSNGSSDNPIQITMNINTSITANFTKVKYAIDITVDGQGSVTEEVVSSGKEYDSGSVVKLTAVPSVGWLFSHWSGASNVIENTVELTADSNKSITAHFIEIPFEAISVGDGTIATELVYNDSNEVTAFKLTATTPVGWRFDGWTGGVQSSEMIIEVATDLVENITATFIQVYDLTLNIVGEGEVTDEIITDTSKTFDAGTNVKLTAVPASGWRFDKWTGSVESNEAVIVVNVDDAKEITATFIQVYDLTVTVEGEGAVTEEIITTTDKSTSYDAGVTVQLTAEPAEGWRFDKWTGAVESTETVVQVEMNEAKDVKATFVQLVDLNITILGEGEVIQEIISDTSKSYDSGSNLRLTGNAKLGWRFESWITESSVVYQNPTTISLIENENITATFVKNYILFTKVLGEGEIIEEIISSDDFSTKIKLTAIPKEGWKFIRWKGGYVSYDTEIIVDISEPLDIKASFVQDNSELTVNKSFFNIDYSYGNELLYNVGGGKRYFEIDGNEYLIVSSDFSDSHLLKKNNETWSLIDEFKSPVSGLPVNNYRGMGAITPISNNEYIVASNGEANTDPLTWGAYVYKGKIQNDNLSYVKITDFKDYYYGSTYGDITGDGLGDIISGYVFTNNGDGSYTQHNITKNTVNNQGQSITQFNTDLNLINLDRYQELNNCIGQKITDLYPGGRDEIIFSFNDVSDRVSEDEIVPRGDVLIYEFDESTQKYEVVFELPRRTIGEVESTEDIQVYDVNNDGINDILLSISTGNPELLQPFEVWLGNSDKTFTKHFEFERQSFVGSGYYVMDINNDGFLDITLLPVGDNAEWIQNWCLDCLTQQELGLPIKDGLKLQNSIWINDGTGRFNVLNKELTIQNSFVIWLLPYMKNGNLNYIGAEYNYIDGETMEIEVLNIEIKSKFFN